MIHLIFNQKKHRKRHSRIVRVALLMTYLFSPRRKVPAQLIQGDVEVVSEVIKSSTYAEPFTSLVLSFSELLTIEKCKEVIREYEEVAFVGIDPSDIARIWVLHQDHGRTELHCVVANVHLSTGKNWKHYYHRSDKKVFKKWQEYTNIKHGFSSPDEPARARMQAPPEKDQNREPDQELIEKIDHKVIEGVMSGRLTNQVEIVDFIEGLGYRAKGCKKQVSVREHGSKERPLRLTGAKYCRDFDSADFFVSRAKKKQEFSRSEERLAELYRELRAGMLIRRNRMSNRFTKNKIKPDKLKNKGNNNDTGTNKRPNQRDHQYHRDPSDRERTGDSGNTQRARGADRVNLIAFGKSLKRKLIRIGLRILNGELRKNGKTMVSEKERRADLPPRNGWRINRQVSIRQQHSQDQISDTRTDEKPTKDDGYGRLFSPSAESKKPAEEMDQQKG